MAVVEFMWVYWGANEIYLAVGGSLGEGMGLRSLGLQEVRDDLWQDRTCGQAEPCVLATPWIMSEAKNDLAWLCNTNDDEAGLQSQHCCPSQGPASEMSWMTVLNDSKGLRVMAVSPLHPSLVLLTPCRTILRGQGHVSLTTSPHSPTTSHPSLANSHTNSPPSPSLLGPFGVPKSREILMFVCLQKDAKDWCEATKLDRTHCAGLRPAQWVRSSFVASHQSLASFWRQTNIEISRDFGALYTVSMQEQGCETDAVIYCANKIVRASFDTA